MNIRDVIIVGGGPAGLNAAVVLGRCRRTVLLFDTGEQRNRFSEGIHNYLTRDDIQPAEFLKSAHKEIDKYGIELSHVEVVHVERSGEGIFKVKDKNQRIYFSRKLLIATGLRDNIPSVPGMDLFYGKSVFHCPYCDGWEVKDKIIGIYAKNKNGLPLSLSLKTWSNDVTLYSDGRNYLSDTAKKTLQRLGIEIVSKKIVSLEGKQGLLKYITFGNAEKRRCDAIFFVNGYNQSSVVLQAMGCKVNKKGIAITNRRQQTNIPGLYVAGDVSKDMHFVVVAASEGAKAGVAINQELQKEEIFAHS